MKVESDEHCRIVQKMIFEKRYHGRDVNSFTALSESGIHLREDGTLYYNDICYSSRYPNSFFDIWYPDKDGIHSSIRRPVIVYLHGGGFLFGDKAEGDPFAAEAEAGISYLAEMCRRGFHVVSANYAFAPQYRFPVQIEQVNLLMGFLQDNKEKYGLDMDQVVLMGGSAGAVLTGIYGLAVSEPEFADKINIQPAVQKEQLKAVVIDEGPFSVKTFTGNIADMFMTWIGVNDLTGREAECIDILQYISGKYPPAFLIASNIENWFYESAERFSAVLEKQGLPYAYFYKDQSYDMLEHGFMQRFESNPYAEACFEAMMRFIKTYCGML